MNDVPGHLLKLHLRIFYTYSHHQHRSTTFAASSTSAFFRIFSARILSARCRFSSIRCFCSADSVFIVVVVAVVVVVVVAFTLDRKLLLT